MSFSRSPRRAALARAGLGLVALAALALTTTACDIPWNSLDDGLREDVEITEVVITGDSGNVTVTGDSTNGVDVRRHVRYGDTEPRETMSISGSVLTVNTDCGPQCSASYEVFVARGVEVRGQNDSGNVRITGASDVEVKVDSGNITVVGATGGVTLEADSGIVEVTDVAGPVRVTVSSGNVTATDVRGVVSLETDSGNITANLPGTANLTARADSGNITVRLPNGCCLITADTNSGNEDISVTQSGGTVVVDLHADSGNIKVSPR